MTTSFPVKGFSDAGHFVEDDCMTLLKYGHKVTVLAPSPGKLPLSRNNDYELRYFTYFLPRNMQRLAYGSGMPVNLKSSFTARIQLPFFFISFLISALRHCKKADVIHCHWFPAGLVGAIIKTLTGKKFVLTMHHTHSSNVIFRWILKKCDHLFCNSTYTLKVTSEIYNVQNSSIMPLRVDTDMFKPEMQGKSSNTFRVLFVGRLIDIKGPDFLIRAFSSFRKKTGAEGSHLDMIGDGPMKDDLINLSVSLGLTDFIHFKGHISRQELPSIYQQSSVFVIPSIEMKDGETEGLGLTAMEASSSGIPVIGSNTGGIPDSIEHGKNGLLFENGDESALAEMLEQLYSNPELVQKLGKEGRDRAVLKYNNEDNYKALINAYNDLV